MSVQHNRSFARLWVCGGVHQHIENVSRRLCASPEGAVWSSVNCPQVMSPESASFGSEEIRHKKQPSGGAVLEGSELYQTSSSSAPSCRQQELLPAPESPTEPLELHCGSRPGFFCLFRGFFGGGGARGKDVWKQENHLIDYVPLISIFLSSGVVDDLEKELTIKPTQWSPTSQQMIFFPYCTFPTNFSEQFLRYNAVLGWICGYIWNGSYTQIYCTAEYEPDVNAVIA